MTQTQIRKITFDIQRQIELPREREEQKVEYFDEEEE